jgi:hypothetical protein
MIALPPGDHFIEAVVFNVPTLMAQTDQQRRGGLNGPQARHPNPLGGHSHALLGELTPLGVMLLRANDTDRCPDWGPGVPTLHVLPLTTASPQPADGNLDAISLLGMNRSLEAARTVGAHSWGGSHDR